MAASVGTPLGHPEIHVAMHLYLSPHFDDAVLSCGGLIAQQTGRGEQVVVVTLCAGAPPPGPVSAFAEFQHQRWLAEHPGADPISLRQAEDRAACSLLGAEPIYLDDLDCIYRRAPDGAWLYDSEESLWGPLHPGDNTTVLAAELARLIERLKPAFIYAPLAAGSHVDHQRARRVAEAWLLDGMPVLFYEDFPYVERGETLWYALNRPAPGPWLRLPQALTASQAQRKQQAAVCYASQLDVLFQGQASARIYDYLALAGAPGLAEVLWQPAIQPRAITSPSVFSES